MQPPIFILEEILWSGLWELNKWGKIVDPGGRESRTFSHVNVDFRARVQRVGPPGIA